MIKTLNPRSQFYLIFISILLGHFSLFIGMTCLQLVMHIISDSACLIHKTATFDHE